MNFQLSNSVNICDKNILFKLKIQMNISKYSTKNYFALQTSCVKITKRQTIGYLYIRVMTYEMESNLDRHFCPINKVYKCLQTSTVK